MAAAASAASARCIGGVEVQIPGGDKIRWVELTVPSASGNRAPDQLPSASTSSRDAASCNVISGDPPAYLVWRIHKENPNVLEAFELFACEEFPGTGLHLVFKDDIYPFAFFCRNENQGAGGNPYLLYVLTVSGVAYLLSLRSPTSYLSGSVFPHGDILEVVVQMDLEIGKITAVTATWGYLVIGRMDGLICSYKLGMMNPNEPGFVNELTDDLGIGRLWNLVSRGKVVAPVQYMTISEVRGIKLLFALQKDGIFRIWNLERSTRIFNHNISSHVLPGWTPLRFWVGDARDDIDQLSFAVLCSSMESEVMIVVVCGLVFSSNMDKVVILPEPLTPDIPLKEGRLIDLKIGFDKIWILKEDESMLYDLFQINYVKQHSCTYDMQESFVADQLFQSSEHALDDLTWTTDGIFSSMKDQAAYFISSIFLRRLLQPGVHHIASLRAAILGHKKYFSDQEFQSLTLSGLKRKIFAMIESEGVAANSTSMVLYWKNFCAHFFRCLYQSNAPFSLLVDSSNNAIGLIRKSSVSLFRDLEGIEQLIYGSSEEFQDLRRSGLALSENDLDCEVLFGLLRCMSNINHQLGRAASAIFYESLISPVVSPDEIIFHWMKVLETGCNPFTEATSISQVGVDVVWEKRRSSHRNQRMFSVDMLLSLRDLHARASSWSRVLDVIEKFIEYLYPNRSEQILESNGCRSINYTIMVQATAQISRVKFESAFDVHVLLHYMINISGQVSMMQADVARIKVKLIPSIQRTLFQWLILHFLCSTPTSPLTMDDFSSRLSSLHIGNKSDRSTWINEKLGLSDFTLAYLLDFPRSFDFQDFVHSKSFPNPSGFIYSTKKFAGLVLWGQNNDGPPFSSIPTLELACILLRHGQYEAAESILTTGTHLSMKKVSMTSSRTSCEQSARFHLLGFCLLLQSRNTFHGVMKEQRVIKAVRCLFRAASEQGASQSLQNFSSETGFVYHGEIGSESVWKFHYYQWAMQIFDQYNMSGAACQFALAALEQVDEINEKNNGVLLPESPTTIRGQLWANVFKFTLDLKQYRDSYCALISNTDEDSKNICLRRFVNVLCELGETKVLCDGSIPFVGLIDKVEQELSRKADGSDISTGFNLYRTLYAFEAKRNNWRKAASNIYRYSQRLSKESSFSENRQYSLVLQERSHALSAAINALHLVDPAHAWIDFEPDEYLESYDSPYKRARKGLEDKSASSVDVDSRSHQGYVDIEMLEKEYILTSAQLLIALVNDKFKFSGSQALATLVDVLVQESFYDMAFTVILKFWKGSRMQRELERAFIAISQKCCPSRLGFSVVGNNYKAQGLLLPSTEGEVRQNGKHDAASLAGQLTTGNGHWGLLELYLNKYRKLHPKLPVTVAETLLYTDCHIELPLWLIQLFKGSRGTASWGMTGQEADPAALFRLYVDYGRLTEATNLLLVHIESLMSPRPADVMRRKKMSAIWLPYAAMERLWCQLEELQAAGHMVEQCEKLKGLMGSLRDYLIQVNSDTEDALAAACSAGQKLPAGI